MSYEGMLPPGPIVITDDVEAQAMRVILDSLDKALATLGGEPSDLRDGFLDDRKRVKDALDDWERRQP